MHQKIAAEVKAKLEAKGKSTEGVETFEAFYGMLKEEAAKLQKEYQPQLRDGIKIAVDLVNSVQKDKQDGDVDVKVRIAPNATEFDLTLATDLSKEMLNTIAVLKKEAERLRWEYVIKKPIGTTLSNPKLLDRGNVAVASLNGDILGGTSKAEPINYIKDPIIEKVNI